MILKKLLSAKKPNAEKLSSRSPLEETDRKLTVDLDYQEKLLSKVNTAREKYKADGNLSDVIQVFEEAFYKADPPCTSTQCLLLVDYYLKAGQNDKAWGYLNYLLSKQLAPLEKIRFSQAKVLKKEGKHLDAIEMIMLGYLAKSQWNRTFQKDMFLKDVQPSKNKLKWDDDKVEYLASLIDDLVKQGIGDEKILISQYRSFLSNIIRL